MIELVQRTHAATAAMQLEHHTAAVHGMYMRGACQGFVVRTSARADGIKNARYERCCTAHLRTNVSDTQPITKWADDSKLHGSVTIVRASVEQLGESRERE